MFQAQNAQDIPLVQQRMTITLTELNNCGIAVETFLQNPQIREAFQIIFWRMVAVGHGDEMRAFFTTNNLPIPNGPDAQTSVIHVIRELMPLPFDMRCALIGRLLECAGHLGIANSHMLIEAAVSRVDMSYADIMDTQRLCSQLHIPYTIKPEFIGQITAQQKEDMAMDILLGGEEENLAMRLDELKSLHLSITLSDIAAVARELVMIQAQQSISQNAEGKDDERLGGFTHRTRDNLKKALHTCVQKYLKFMQAYGLSVTEDDMQLLLEIETKRSYNDNRSPNYKSARDIFGSKAKPEEMLQFAEGHDIAVDEASAHRHALLYCIEKEIPVLENIAVHPPINLESNLEWDFYAKMKSNKEKSKEPLQFDESERNACVQKIVTILIRTGKETTFRNVETFMRGVNGTLGVIFFDGIAVWQQYADALIMNLPHDEHKLRLHIAMISAHPAVMFPPETLQKALEKSITMVNPGGVDYILGLMEDRGDLGDDPKPEVIMTLRQAVSSADFRVLVSKDHPAHRAIGDLMRVKDIIEKEFAGESFGMDQKIKEAIAGLSVEENMALFSDRLHGALLIKKWEADIDQREERWRDSLSPGKVKLVEAMKQHFSGLADMGIDWSEVREALIAQPSALRVMQSNKSTMQFEMGVGSVDDDTITFVVVKAGEGTIPYEARAYNIEVPRPKKAKV